MVRSGLSLSFGVPHALWLDFAIVLPLGACAVLLVRRWRRVRPVAVAACLALLAVPVAVYGSFVEPQRLVVERATVAVPHGRAGHRPIRVVVIADLQFERWGSRERRAIRRADAQHPDLILIAGDIHQGTPASFRRQRATIRRGLGALRAPAGVFAVQGDQENPAKARSIYAGTHIALLNDRVVRLRVRDRRITLGGLALRYRSASARATRNRLEAAGGGSDIRILLVHRPDAVLDLSRRSRIDLTVAGHTHGGQIQLPGVGPLSIASAVPHAVGAGGLHSLRGNAIYVSRGIGVERGQAPRVRIGTAPELSVLMLR